jgi:hypothetical protein
MDPQNTPSAFLWILGVICLVGLAVMLLHWLRPSRCQKCRKKRSLEPNTCCSEREWEPVADLGHTAGVDFDLGRCKNCGTYLMAVFYVNSITYNVLSKQQGERFLRLQGSPELKRSLKRWFDS